MLTRRLVKSLSYYASSVPTLAFGTRNPITLLKLLRRSDGPVTLELRDGSRFLLRTLLDAWVVKETVLDRVYEVFSTPIGAEWSIVDVGAGLGDFTVRAARRAGRGRVHAYEPAPGSAALLRCNLELNGVAHVTVYEEAVAACRGRVLLDQGVPEAVMIKLATNAAPDGRGGVPAVTLDQVVGRLPGERCDLLKLDCEGAEFEILLGADRGLFERIDRISLEYHDFDRPGRHRELAAYLAAGSYSVRVRPSEVYRELGYLYCERAPATAPSHGGG